MIVQIFKANNGEYMSISIEERFKRAETRVCKAVFPSTVNHHDTLFGGQALSWMDETAFIAATRFCHKPLVTVSSDRIDFSHPIPAGSIVELVGSIDKVGRTSIRVKVDIFVESMTEEGRTKAISGMFSLVAVDENRKPTPIMDES
ncbi:MAG: acyl-CoA thioesterase [Moritella sp.]|uniref:acyl-CoA thioesterase n=1 Tax=Moritella sp. TaxID=78556 RepID=UPI000C0DA881|nr:acyl-CoA thioesterase [Moritella sp.]MBL1416233.1 acyl-CoA thioesterase [Moritella sp.]PHR86021.1 MAG: acyl-CoA thioesterase [Moritella sp.]